MSERKRQEADLYEGETENLQCPDLDEETGEPLDVVYQTPIPPERLIRLNVNNKMRCYDLTTLKRIIDTEEQPKEPLTRIPFSAKFIDFVKNHPAIQEEEKRKEENSFYENVFTPDQQRDYDNFIRGSNNKPIVDFLMKHLFGDDDYIEDLPLNKQVQMRDFSIFSDMKEKLSEIKQQLNQHPFNTNRNVKILVWKIFIPLGFIVYDDYKKATGFIENAEHESGATHSCIFWKKTTENINNRNIRRYHLFVIFPKRRLFQGETETAINHTYARIIHILNQGEYQMTSILSTNSENPIYSPIYNLEGLLLELFGIVPRCNFLDRKTASEITKLLVEE